MRDDAYVLLTCPYEETHRIEKYRMARHLTKCEESHPNIKLEECPFNTLHRIKPLEFQHHLSVCEDRISSVSILYQKEFSRPVESITVEEVNSINLPLTENWDTETESVASYNPLEHIQKKNIFFTPMLLSKSKRKLIKLKERERHNALANDTDTESTKKEVPKLKDELEIPLRLPRNPSQALIKNKKQSENDIIIESNKEKTDKENILKDSTKQNLKKELKSKYMDDLTTFTKTKNCIETNNNSVNKDGSVEVTLNNTAETGKNAATDFFKDIQRNTDKRCSVGRGISRIYEMYKKSGASKENFQSYFMNPKNDITLIMKRNTEAHDYTGTFFGYTEEESFLDVKDIEDELSIIDGFGTD